MPVQSGEITNILLLLQGQHQCVLVALAKTVSQFIHNCTHIYFVAVHKVRYRHYSGACVRLVPIVPTSQVMLQSEK